MMEFRKIRTADVDQIIEKAQSTDYIGAGNLCDFYEEENARENLLEDISVVDNINYSFFVEEYQGEIMGYIRALFFDEDFLISPEIQSKYRLPTNLFKMGYIMNRCSFSRMRRIYNLGIQGVGQKLWSDIVLYTSIRFPNNYTVLWNHSTDTALEFHKKMGMILNDKYSDWFLNKLFSNNQTVFQIVGEEPQELNLFYIVKGINLRDNNSEEIEIENDPSDQNYNSNIDYLIQQMEIE